MLATRRVLMGTSLLALPALAGCAWLTSNGSKIVTVTNQVVSDVNAVATALSQELPALTPIIGASTAAAASVVALVAQIVSAAGKVVVGMVANVAQPFVQQIQSDYAAVKSALSGFSLPAAIAKVLQAIDVVMPLILLAVGLAAPASAAAHGMSPSDARKILAGVR